MGPRKASSINQLGFTSTRPAVASASSSRRTSGGHRNSNGSAPTISSAPALASAISGPVSMTTRSAITAEPDFRVGILRLQVAHGYAEPRELQQELHSLAAAQLCGFT